MADHRPEDAPALDQLLASLGPADQMRAFYEARLGRLQEYDERHSAQLIPTLDAYFAAGRSLSAAAERLRTHRNTVLYRLRRIEELMQLRLRDPQVELELQVALRIRAALNRWDGRRPGENRPGAPSVSGTWAPRRAAPPLDVVSSPARATLSIRPV